jgi:dihydroorotate dehydrogenase
VQVGTANYLNPMAAAEVAEGIADWAARAGVGSVRELVGTLILEPPGR